MPPGVIHGQANFLTARAESPSRRRRLAVEAAGPFFFLFLFFAAPSDECFIASGAFFSTFSGQRQGRSMKKTKNKKKHLAASS